MTFLKDVTDKQKLELTGILNQEMALLKYMIEIHERAQKKLRKEILFFKDILRNRQTLENLDLRLKHAREKRTMEVEKT